MVFHVSSSAYRDAGKYRDVGTQNGAFTDAHRHGANKFGDAVVGVVGMERVTYLHEVADDRSASDDDFTRDGELAPTPYTDAVLDDETGIDVREHANHGEPNVLEDHHPVTDGDAFRVADAGRWNND